LDEYPEVRDEEYKTISGAAVQRVEEGLTDIKVQLRDLDSVLVGNSVDTADALHTSIDEARVLIQGGDSQIGRFLLQRLRGSKWDRMDARHRFRLLSNIAAAYLKEQNYPEAAEHFL